MKPDPRVKCWPLSALYVSCRSRCQVELPRPEWDWRRVSAALCVTWVGLLLNVNVSTFTRNTYTWVDCSFSVQTWGGDWKESVEGLSGAHGGRQVLPWCWHPSPQLRRGAGAGSPVHLLREKSVHLTSILYGWICWRLLGAWVKWILFHALSSALPDHLLFHDDALVFKGCENNKRVYIWLLICAFWSI